MKIYCMSDIHGCINEFKEALSLILEHLNEDNTKLVLLGDYIHGDNYSYEVLDRIMSLQEKYGSDKVVALMGNHEDLVLTGYASINDANEEFEENDNDDKYIEWMRNLPTYYTEGNTIFCHAGIDEEAGEDWQWGTSNEIFVGKYPASIGKIEGLNKKVVAGHVPTSEITGNDKFHDIYYDGESHYYIDGGTIKSGYIPVLLVDTDLDRYYQVYDNNDITEIKNK